MTEEGHGSGGRGAAGPIGDVIAQLRGITDRLTEVTGLARAMPPLPGLEALRRLPPMPPLPGALSAGQLRSISTGVAAQRSSIAALRAQLDAFDAQLEVLEKLIGPLTEWSATWAQLEKRLTELGAGERRDPAR